jgi:superfamily II DNA or RNA helicase
MSLRDQRQQELCDKWIESEKFGIILAAPRTGKSRIGVLILNTFNPQPSVLIAYPDGKIRQSWIDEFEIMNYINPNVTFTTHLSLHKYKDASYDIVIIDEVHLLSEQQLITCYELLKLNKICLALTGTLAKDTRKTIKDVLGLNVIAEYSIEQAIEEGIIANYEISVVSVPLDNKVKLYNGKTEKQKFDNVSWVINKLVKEGKDTFFLRLQRMRIIQNSLAKKNKTISLLKEYENQRVLTFCGVIKIADSLGIPSYHSKSTEKNLFEDFVKGDIKQLAVCKIGNTGTTYLNLSRVIINFFDSNSQNMTQKINRCMNFDYDNAEKVAKITILSSTEPTESAWLHKSLELFNKSKIKYL